MLAWGSFPRSPSPCPAARPPPYPSAEPLLSPHPDNRPVLGLDPTYDPRAPTCIPPSPSSASAGVNSAGRMGTLGASPW